MGLDKRLFEAWRPRIDALFARLDAARDASLLPWEPTTRKFEGGLLAVRRSRFG